MNFNDQHPEILTLGDATPSLRHCEMYFVIEIGVEKKYNKNISSQLTNMIIRNLIEYLKKQVLEYKAGRYQEFERHSFVSFDKL